MFDEGIDERQVLVRCRFTDISLGLLWLGRYGVIWRYCSTLGWCAHGTCTRATYGKAERGITGALPRHAGDRINCQAALTAIVFSAFFASAVLGSFTLNTPLAKCASILSASTPSGS